MQSSVAFLRHLTRNSYSRSLSGTGYPALAATKGFGAPVRIRASAALYSSQSNQTDKPYYVTTPIFYVNAGNTTLSYRLRAVFISVYLDSMTFSNLPLQRMDQHSSSCWTFALCSACGYN